MYKSGRTSGTTLGRVTSLNSSVAVRFRDRGTVVFKGVISVEHFMEDFLEPGDSGSFVLNEKGKVIGLGFAANDRYSRVIPIERVVSEFGVEI